MITEWELYFILILDRVVNFLFLVGMITSLSSLVSFFVFLVLCLQEGSPRRFVKYSIISFFAGMSILFFACIIPDTKQMAIIKVVPAIANSESIDTLKGDAADLYKLGIESAKKYLKGEK